MALTCPACGAEFETQEQLDEHTRTEHGSSFRCPACGAGVRDAGAARRAHSVDAPDVKPLGRPPGSSAVIPAVSPEPELSRDPRPA